MAGRGRAHRAAASATAITLAAAVVGCAPPPERSTAAAPRPDAPRLEAMVVATIHKGHLVEERYPVGLLCRIIAAYQPDLVMVEIRPEPFAAGRLEDGPFEMTAATLCARERGVRVVPIDWWLEEDMTAEPKPSPEDARALDAELAPLVEPKNPPFVVANAPSELARGLRMLNAEARYLGGNPIWQRRQAWFHHRAIEAIDRYRPRRALAFVGYNHAPELAGFLGAFGATMVSPLSLALGEPRGANDAVSAPIVAAWRSGAERLRAQAASANGEAKGRYAAKAAYFEVAASRAGRCCVAEDALKPRSP